MMKNIFGAGVEAVVHLESFVNRFESLQVTPQ